DEDKDSLDIQSRENKSTRRKRLLHQSWIVCLVGLGYVSLGQTTCFPSVMASDMDKYNTTIWGTYITFTPTQMDMCGSVTQIASLLGVWMAGILAGHLGRLSSMKLFSVLFILAWLGISLVPSAPTILAA
ncbi:unnamed protein product, partial [Meganyctiphanes norvegica]